MVFRKPIPVDTSVQLEIVRHSADEASIRLTLADEKAAAIRVGFLPTSSDVGSEVPSGRPDRCAPRELAAADIADAKGTVSPCLDRDLARGLFPELFRSLSLRQVAELLATTRIVGMECPGSRSRMLPGKLSPRSGTTGPAARRITSRSISAVTACSIRC